MNYKSKTAFIFICISLIFYCYSYIKKREKGEIVHKKTWAGKKIFHKMDSEVYPDGRLIFFSLVSDSSLMVNGEIDDVKFDKKEAQIIKKINNRVKINKVVFALPMKIEEIYWGYMDNKR